MYHKYCRIVYGCTSISLSYIACTFQTLYFGKCDMDVMDVYSGSTSNIFNPIPMGWASQLRFLTIANPRWSTHVQSPAAAWWSVAWTTLLTLPSAEMDGNPCTSGRCTCWSYDTTGKHHEMCCIMCIWYVGKFLKIQQHKLGGVGRILFVWHLLDLFGS